MKSQKNRLEQIERKTPSIREQEPVFLYRAGQEWTDEQKEWIRRRHPDCKIFMKPLSETMPYGYERQGEKAVALYRDLCSLVDWDPEKQKKHDDEIRNRIEEESRLVNERWRKSKDLPDE